MKNTQNRYELVEEINSQELERRILEGKYGKIWNTAQLLEDFSVEGFLAPFVKVKRKSDGVIGTLKFQHSPRYYFSFEKV